MYSLTSQDPSNSAVEPTAKKARTDDMAASAPVPAPASRKEFEAIFPGLVEDVIDHVKQYNMPKNAIEWFQTVCYLSRRLLNLRVPRAFAILNPTI